MEHRTGGHSLLITIPMGEGLRPEGRGDAAGGGVWGRGWPRCYGAEVVHNAVMRASTRGGAGDVPACLHC
jgi:hypothetical protein